MSGDCESVEWLLSQARQAGLSFGVCGGRLWIHVSGEQLYLLHLAGALLIRERAVLSALGVTVAPQVPGADHDAPYTFGAPPSFEDAEWRRLRALRERLGSGLPAEDQPASN